MSHPKDDFISFTCQLPALLVLWLNDEAAAHNMSASDFLMEWLESIRCLRDSPLPIVPRKAIRMPR